MANGVYSAVIVYIDGQLLTEEAQVSINFNSGKVPVKSVQKGLCGFSIGAGQDDITIDFNVPSEDFEINPTDFVHDVVKMKDDPNLKIWHQVDLICAGKSYSTNGFSTTASLSHGVDSSSKCNLSFTCKPALFK